MRGKATSGDRAIGEDLRAARMTSRFGPTQRLRNAELLNVFPDIHWPEDPDQQSPRADHETLNLAAARLRYIYIAGTGGPPSASRKSNRSRTVNHCLRGLHRMHTLKLSRTSQAIREQALESTCDGPAISNDEL